MRRHFCHPRAVPDAPIVVVHGGSGALTPERLEAEAAEKARAGLRRALDAGLTVLRAGGSAVDAVVTAVAVLEDDESFNAGRGSALTAAGTVEHDASVADGATGRAGAVGGVCGPRHPVEVARAVMERTPHVLMAGAGAEAVARAAGLAFEDPGWFVTERRRAELAASGGAPTAAFGTVGAVALDLDGHLAAATSTGGVTGQAVGRIGDSPGIGAGTWAVDRTCAVSGTGHGESYIRVAFAHEVDAQIRLAGADLDRACASALAAVTAIGGSGGCIALTAAGSIAMPFTTRGMHRGWIDHARVPRVAVFGGEEPA